MSTTSNKNVIYFNSKTKRYVFLSNVFSSKFMIDGNEYWHMEGYFLSQMFAGVNSKVETLIREAFSPLTCRKLASNYLLPVERKKEWSDGLRDTVMMKGLITKFVTNTRLGNLLVSTGDCILVYSDVDDTYWGSGKDGNGENKLGILLMSIRTFLTTMKQD